MPIAVSDDELAITDAVAGFAARHAALDQTRQQLDALASGDRPSFWDALVRDGWQAVHVPEEFGGQGGGLIDAACVVDAAGFALLPGPLLPTTIAAAAVATAEPGAARTAVLEAVANGSTATLVLPEAGVLQAVSVDDGWALSGAVGPDVGIPGADWIVVSTTDGRWLVVSAASTTVTAQTPTDTTRAVGTLTVDGFVVADDAVLAGVDTDRARCIAVGLMAAEAAGIARWCVDTLVAYLKVREQFGRPIGTFQALQHKAARLFIASELAASAAWDAVRAADQAAGQQRVATASAALTALTPLPELVVDALTMFGAIGFTWEHDLHLYWKRAIALAASVGPASRWARQLGDLNSPARDFTIETTDVEPTFRARVAAALDAANAVENDTPGRQNPDYPEFATGAQRDVLVEAGLVAPYLPTPWGLAATPTQQLIIDEEFDRRPSLVRPSLGIAEWILPTILAGGTDQQRKRFADPTVRGEIAWCQLFSEPGAGSDLASLSTRATRVEGGWRVNGQKVWTSSAQRADFGALLARTDPDASKHKGISYFVVDMSSPGITVRPLRTASGEAHFNEVFFDDLFVPDDGLIGDPGAGWSLALATMANERVAIGAYIKMDRERVLRSLATTPGADTDAVTLALGDVRAQSNAIAALGVRDTIGRLEGHLPGPASSIGKVATALIVRRISALALDLSGRAALVGGPEHPAVDQSLTMPAEVIGGGTIEIQLNIIATMILGLPRK